MDPRPDDAVHRWLATRALQELGSTAFAQVDIDELFDEPPATAVRVGLDCLRLALDEARKVHPQLDAVLTVPLPASDVLGKEAPTLSSVFDQSWTYGPGIQVVGLYLIHPRVWRAYEAVEEYRSHLPGTELLPSGFAAYYRSWRRDEEAMKGWEYNCAIYIRTTP